MSHRRPHAENFGIVSYKSGQRRDTDIVPTFTPLPNIHDTEFIYLEVSFRNQTNINAPAVYSQNRTDSVVDRGSDYKLAVVKLSINLDLIPMFVLSQKNLSVTLAYPATGDTFTQNLFGSLPVNTPFYNVNSVLNEPEGLNASLATALTGLIATVGGGYAGTTNPPFFSYDASTDKFTLYVPDPGYASNDPNRVEIFLSNDLARLFEGLLEPLIPSNLLPANNTQFIVYANNGINAITLGGVNYLFNTQQYSSSELWYDIRKILLLSKGFDTRKSYISTTTSNNRNISQPVLTDFTVTHNNTDQAPSTVLIYFPQGAYRWIDITTDDAISDLTFEFFYQTRSGDILPVLLSPGDSFDITLVFARVVL